MKEMICVPVIVGDHEKELIIEYEDDVITLYLEGKKLCSMSYAGNFEEILNRILKIW